ncbi:hypothetical protein ACH5RR_013968 [Cinchona calisaya]|uniref:PPIase cyclophilin-type domain-containing protein n=1 Tax=Cinchona calisaya TaxID=153742 RepID=A0ABD3A3W5_9GENT
MGKKQHRKDRLFITTTEWGVLSYIYTIRGLGLHQRWQRLRYYIRNIIPHIRKYGKSPVTGDQLKPEDLIPLVFHENAEGEYHCPVLNKVSQSSLTVAVKTTVNVFSYEALKELGTEKAKEISLHGGDAAFASVHGRSANAAKSASGDKTGARITLHMVGERTPVNAKLVKGCFTTGAASWSFTSTAYDPVSQNEYEYIKVEKNPKKKGYVRLHTTHGVLLAWPILVLTQMIHSSFFILCKSANHLNFKHPMFGGVVGGLTTLSAMEKVPVDDDDRPLEEIKTIEVEVYVNPYTESDEEEEKKRSQGLGGGVGKNSHVECTAAVDSGRPAVSVAKKRKVGFSTGELKDFSSWLVSWNRLVGAMEHHKEHEAEEKHDEKTAWLAQQSWQHIARSFFWWMVTSYLFTAHAIPAIPASVCILPLLVAKAMVVGHLTQPGP